MTTPDQPPEWLTECHECQSIDVVWMISRGWLHKDDTQTECLPLCDGCAMGLPQNRLEHYCYDAIVARYHDLKDMVFGYEPRHR